MSPTPGKRANSSRSLDGGVVAEVDTVAAAVGGIKVDDHQNAGRFLSDGDAPALDGSAERVGPARRGSAPTPGRCSVGAGFKSDGEGVFAVVGALRRHIQHVLDAVDLLFDGRGHRCRRSLRRWRRIDAVTSTVGGVMFGYCAIGNVPTGDEAAQRDDDRHHGGENRPINEKRENIPLSSLRRRLNSLIVGRRAGPSV